MEKGMVEKNSRRERAEKELMVEDKRGKVKGLRNEGVR